MQLTNKAILFNKTILIIGGSRKGGFGYALAQIARDKGCNVIVAGRSSSEIIFDVAKDDYGALYEKVRERTAHLDAIFVTPAYLKREYFEYFGGFASWDCVSEEDKEKCRNVTVYPIQKIADTFKDILSVDAGTNASANSSGVIYGLSFPLKNLPGYPIGHAKEELERLVIDELAPYLKQFNIRANILSLGPYPSVSASIIRSFPLIEKLQALLGCKKLTVEEMAELAAKTLGGTKTGRIYEIDGGLGKAARENPEIVEQECIKFINEHKQIQQDGKTT